MRRLWGLGLAVAVLSVVPSTAAAQLELDGYLGAYIPLNNLVAVEGVNPAAQQKTALAVGARATVWLAVLGIEATFMYAASDRESDESGVMVDTSAEIWAASARLALKLGLPVVPITFYFNGGPALIGRGGKAYEDAEDKTDIGGVLGGAVLLGRGKIRLRGDVEAYLYSFTEPGISIDSQFQTDIVVSAGLVLAL